MATALPAIVWGIIVYGLGLMCVGLAKKFSPWWEFGPDDSKPLGTLMLFATMVIAFACSYFFTAKLSETASNILALLFLIEAVLSVLHGFRIFGVKI